MIDKLGVLVVRGGGRGGLRLQGVRLAIALMLCAFALLSSATPSYAQETQPTAVASGQLVTLQARVPNGTAGGTVPDGLIITLQVFDEDVELQRLDGEVESGGVVSFGGVINNAEVAYTLSTAYNDVRFFSDAYLAAVEREGPLELTIYESTSDPSVMRIVGDSSVVSPVENDAGTLRVLQVTTYENVSDRAFVGQDPDNTRLTIQLPLPALAFDLEAAHNPGSLVLAPESRSVYSILPVLPGIEEVIVTYSMLYTTNIFAWSKTYPYSTAIVRLLTPEGITFRPGSAWTQMPASEVSGVTYSHHEIMNIAAETTLTATFADLPTSAGARSRNLEDTLRNVAIAVAVGALVVAAAFPFYWGRFRRRRRVEPSMQRAQNLQSLRDDAVAELSRLEDAREAGTISEEEYEEQSRIQREALRRIIESEQFP